MTLIDQHGPAIAVLGEAIVDFVPHGAARVGRREMPMRAVPGGSPLNTAVAASRLGQSVAALTQFSTDVFGELLVQHLHDNGVSTRWASRSDDPCALAFVIETPGGAQFTFGMPTSTVWILPSLPERTSSQALRNRASERCCDPVCTTRSCFRAASTIFRPSLIVSERGFSQ